MNLTRADQSEHGLHHERRAGQHHDHDPGVSEGPRPPRDPEGALDDDEARLHHEVRAPHPGGPPAERRQHHVGVEESARREGGRETEPGQPSSRERPEDPGEEPHADGARPPLAPEFLHGAREDRGAVKVVDDDAHRTEAERRRRVGGIGEPDHERRTRTQPGQRPRWIGEPRSEHEAGPRRPHGESTVRARSKSRRAVERRPRVLQAHRVHERERVPDATQRRQLLPRQHQVEHAHATDETHQRQRCTPQRVLGRDLPREGELGQRDDQREYPPPAGARRDQSREELQGVGLERGHRDEAHAISLPDRDVTGESMVSRAIHASPECDTGPLPRSCGIPVYRGDPTWPASCSQAGDE